jgi:hypothetical protein
VYFNTGHEKENRQRGWRSFLPWAKRTAAYREQGASSPARHDMLLHIIMMK